MFTEVNLFHMNPVMRNCLGKPFYQSVKRPEAHWSNEASLRILILRKFFVSSSSTYIWITLLRQKNWWMGI